MKVHDTRHRLKYLALACLMTWLIFVVRLFQLQVISHSSYEAKAVTQHNRRVPLSAVRGTIYDRNGEVLAQDIGTSSVWAYRSHISNKASVAGKLSSILGLSYSRVLKQLSKKGGYVLIARKISPEAEARLREAKLRGVDLVDDTKRVYPLGQAACHVVGLVNTDGEGTEGIEAGFNSYLVGNPGWFMFAHDAMGENIVTSKSLTKKPRPGASVVLTIDARYQAMAASSLKRAMAEHRASGGTVVMVEPSTGEILAMVNEPGFDPADSRTWEKGCLRNRAVTDQFEPGSTFKLVTVSAVLEEQLADSSTMFYAENGLMNFGKFRIRDTSKHGWITLKQFFAYSSNIVAAKLGLQLGRERFYRYCRAFNFGATTGVDLPGEASGRMRNPSAWSERSLPTMAMGQELSATAIQLAMAYAAIANDGTYMRPQMVKRIVDSDGKTIKACPPRAVRRVVSASTSRTVREFLASAVECGTGRTARIDWCRVGGKTGTAQKYSPVTRSYSLFVGSFVGLVPAENTKLVCLVLLDEPAERHLGALVAAPVFKEVVETASKCSRSPLCPQFEKIPFHVKRGELLPIPDVRLLGEENSVHVLRKSGFRAQCTGLGARVIWQEPRPGTLARAGETVRLGLGESDQLSKPAAKLPQLEGLSLREALRQLSSISVSARVAGSGLVVSQFPPAGTELRQGQQCVLQCRLPGSTI
ncbi:MAG: penicillin-binding transpeptidase domain-containing protein [Candidatus Eisenbacteria bacterium]